MRSSGVDHARNQIDITVVRQNLKKQIKKTETKQNKCIT
jgi:hypothetical protein